MRLLSLAIVACTLLLSVRPATQNATGDLAGTVRDDAGAAVAGAVVSILRSGVLQGATLSDRRGAFTFKGLAFGSYDLAVEAPGFVRAQRVVRVAAVTRPLTIVLQQARNEREEKTRDALSQRFNPSVAESLVGGVAGSPPASPRSLHPSARYAGPFNTEAYDRIHENGFRRVGDHPLSTFSVDVDTASYANVRRFLLGGSLPPADAVRVEELVNYFRFDYPQPDGDLPFSVTTEFGPCPWNPTHRLALVGLQGRRLPQGKTPPRNLVFLLDVSGSMMPANKLPLVKTAMRLLVDTLTDRDRVAIVVYAGRSGVVLPATRGSDRAVILQALESLEAGGSTNGAAGIHAAYDLAATAFVKDGINRVILATDGDFNVGVTSQGELLRLIEQKRETGVFLSVLGVGEGNLKDSTMEKLADAGNGNYAYLDSLHEARRVLIEEAGSTLVTIAKDVKVQVEFNPRAVAAYRLIGYENRLLQNEDFNDDRKDAGDIGAGHSVTALYEIVPPGVEPPGLPPIDPLRYQAPAAATGVARRAELMTVKLRYKDPDGETSRLITRPVADAQTRSPRHLGFAASVAAFGMLLRGSEHRGHATYAQTLDLARANRGDDPRGYRAEFLRLLELAAALDGRPHHPVSPISRR